jgi:hypothetical protein
MINKMSHCNFNTDILNTNYHAMCQSIQGESLKIFEFKAAVIMKV